MIPVSPDHLHAHERGQSSEMDKGTMFLHAPSAAVKEGAATKHQCCNKREEGHSVSDAMKNIKMTEPLSWGFIVGQQDKGQ